MVDLSIVFCMFTRGYTKSAGKPQTHPSDPPVDGTPNATAVVTATASPKKRAQLDADLSPVSMKENPNRSRKWSKFVGKKQTKKWDFNGTKYDVSVSNCNHQLWNYDELWGFLELKEPGYIYIIFDKWLAGWLTILNLGDLHYHRWVGKAIWLTTIMNRHWIDW